MLVSPARTLAIIKERGGGCTYTTYNNILSITTGPRKPDLAQKKNWQDNCS